MTEVTKYGVDPRAESRNAVKALIAVLYKRFPGDIAQIENWTDGYFDNLGNMKPEGIKAVSRDVLNSWRWKRPPLPGDFVGARDAHLAAAKARRADPDNTEIPDVSQAVKAGQRAWENFGYPTLGEYWEGLYLEHLASLDETTRSLVERYVAEDLALMKSHGWVQAKDRKPIEKRGFKALPAIPGINAPAEEFEEAAEE